MGRREKKLEDRIHDFMERKSKEYPDLHLTDSSPAASTLRHSQRSTWVRPHVFHGRIADVF